MTVAFGQFDKAQFAELHRSVPLTPAAAVRLRELVMTSAPALADQLEGAAAELLREIGERARRHVVTIGVVGQVKAGKSFFVNAMVGRPQLLPTSVNPWTSAVTRLHFGHPSGLTAGARFSFFSDQEWRELAEAGGRLHMIRERLLPDPDPEVLRAQLTEVRARAKRRLGPDFARLLGSAHTFERLEPGLLARYVASGEAAAEGPSYGDVTKCADIYLDASPFQLPVTIIDTPGTNDPFLVREEMTARSLSEIEIAVVVLSARQALSNADLSLMRVLAGLRKDRMIVFVNRCDELAEPEREIPQVREHVAAVLRQEFGHDIPVVMGSALWWHAAATAEPSLCGELLTGAFAAYAERLGQPGPSAVTAAPGGAAQPPAEAALAALREASGLPALFSLLSRKIGGGDFASWIASTFQTLRVVCQQNLDIARRELRMHEQSVQRAHFDAMQAGHEVQRLQEAARRLEAATRTLQRITDERTAEIVAVQREGIERLRKAMLHQIEAHIERERSAYLLLLDNHSSAGNKPLRIDVSKLRRAIEQTFIGEYRGLHGRIVEIQLSTEQTFDRIIREELPRTDLDVNVKAVPGSFAFPSLSALGRVNAFNADPKLWGTWRRRQTSMGAALTAFEALLREEFTRIADELVGAAERQVGEAVIALQRQLQIAISTAMSAAKAHRATIALRLEQVAVDSGGDRLLDSSIERLSSTRARFDRLQSLARTLGGGTSLVSSLALAELA